MKPMVNRFARLVVGLVIRTKTFIGRTMQSETEIPRYRKRAPKHKPWGIEARSTNVTGWACLDLWHTWCKYETKEQAEQALKALRQGHASLGWEWRIKNHSP